VRWLILSDIHANLEALKAVLAEAARDGFDKIACCGDVVGYGADPNACTEWVRSSVPYIVRGNHDKAGSGLDDLEWFNPAARNSAFWTQQTLTPENLAYLRAMPKGPLEIGGFQIVHGSPLDEDEYLLSASEASQLIGYLETRVSFFGHTHLQGGFQFHRSKVIELNPVELDQDRLELTLHPDCHYLINPGSVGQPRDGDPRAAWSIYVPEERLVIYRRTPYDIPAAQEKIKAAGLPTMLAHRLAVGH